MPQLTEEKERARAVWTAGDYPYMVQFIASVGETTADRAELNGGDGVLDIACGTGNASFPAARAGAKVTGLDLTPKLLDAGRARAAEDGIEIDFVEGDAEELPFEDESFDVVLSVFGIMFAPDHARAAGEAARVLRPGGRMVISSWTPEGETGVFFGLTAKHMPPPPDGFQPPLLWGSEEHVRSLFEGTGLEFEFERTAVSFEFDSVDEAVDLFETKFGPVVTAKAMLEPDGKWEPLRNDIVAYFEERAGDGGTISYDAEYLIAKGSKSG